jgi:hypothetical protein
VSVDTLFRRAALCAALALSTSAFAMTSAPETDVPPTQADQRFKAKYGIWPPHITAEKRAEKDRARAAAKSEQKDKKEKDVKVKQERDRTA